MHLSSFMCVISHSFAFSLMSTLSLTMHFHSSVNGLASPVISKTNHSQVPQQQVISSALLATERFASKGRFGPHVGGHVAC